MGMLRSKQSKQVTVNVIHVINDSQDGVSEYQSYIQILGCSKVPSLHTSSACMSSLALFFMYFHVSFPKAG